MPLTTIVAIVTRTQCASKSEHSLDVLTGCPLCPFGALPDLVPHLKQLHVLALWDVTVMLAIARLTMAKTHFKTNSIGLQLQAEYWYRTNPNLLQNPKFYMGYFEFYSGKILQ